MVTDPVPCTPNSEPAGRQVSHTPSDRRRDPIDRDDMSLHHPNDLSAWQHSIASTRSPIRKLRTRLRSRAEPTPALLLLPAISPGAAGDRNSIVDMLIVIDTPTASQLAALLAPMRHLPAARVAVLTSAGAGTRLPLDPGSTSVTIADHHDLTRALPDLRCVLTYGHYMHLGAMADATARTVGASSFVAQHGILTPFAPPLPEHSQLLAWSEDDAAYWTLGRPDVETHVVGSQLLHEATGERPVPSGDREPPDGITYLGQLHGYELPRRSMASAATRFCREHGAVYRPHPSETDLVSRLEHALWRSRGISFDLTRRPLDQLRTSVVSVFSTGVLEAAAAGIPAWVDHPDPPDWITELWGRYRMQRFGSTEPTRIATSEKEPARAIAELLITRAADGA